MGPPHLNIQGHGRGSPPSLGVSGSRESLLLSANFLPAFRARLWPLAPPPHLPVSGPVPQAPLLRRPDATQPPLLGPNSCSSRLRPQRVHRPCPCLCLCPACLPAGERYLPCKAQPKGHPPQGCFAVPVKPPVPPHPLLLGRAKPVAGALGEKESRARHAAPGPGAAECPPLWAGQAG